MTHLPADRYRDEAPAPEAPTLFETITYIFNEEMRRGWVGMRGLDDADLNLDPGKGTMSIGAILAHEVGLIRFMTETLKPGSAQDISSDEIGEEGDWNLSAIIEAREALGDRFRQVLADTNPGDLMGKRPAMPPQAWAEWPVLMRILRPLIDFATHVGQVNYARRRLGKPLT